MKKAILAAFYFMCMSCGGDVVNPVGICNDGGTFCRAASDHRVYGGYCCPMEYPYCPTVGATNCPMGSCCNNPSN